MTKVMVACKLPNGLIAELLGPEELVETNGPNGTIKSARRASLGRVLLRGSAEERILQRADDKGRPIDMPGLTSVQGGFGLTEVDEDFITAWMAQNKDYPPVKNGLIFYVAKGGTSAAAKERKELLSGFEPINPAKLDEDSRLKAEKRAA